MTENQKKRIQCTVSILTHNSGKTLRRALESVKDFEEIIINDGNSSDNTLEIASEYDAQILHQDKQYLDKDGRIIDFAGVRNQSLIASTQNWFFFLDSDEYCGEDLVSAITQIIKNNDVGAYFVNRRYVRGGVVIDCATTYPNRQMRFFARSVTEHFIKKVHERIQMKEGITSKISNGLLYVPLDDTPADMREKWSRYIAIEVARHAVLSWGVVWSVTWASTKVSLLYFLRLIRILILCRGTRMPLSLELERHRYHVRLIVAFWSAKLRL